MQRIPQCTTGLDQAFGLTDIYELLPAQKDIPEEFWSCRNQWAKLVSTWFFNGLPKTTDFYPKEGVVAKAAFKHVAACMGSWEPEHEHKTAGCAYLLSEFFEKVTIDGETVASHEEI